MNHLSGKKRVSSVYYLSLVTLILLLGAIFFTINKAMDQQRIRSKAASDSMIAAVTPTFGVIAPCPSCDSPSEPPSPSGMTPPSGTVIEPTTGGVNPVPGEPCTAEGTSIAHEKPSKHTKHEGNISGFMEALLRFFMELLNLILRLLGGGSVNPNPPAPITAPQQPSTVPPNPCPPGAPIENPLPSVVQPSVAAPSGTVPSLAPSVILPSQPGGGGSTDPTAATCGGPANTPAAPVTGYTIKKCEDFNGTSMPSGWGAYDGGGEGTVVGIGRRPQNCTFGNGVVTLTQEANGATCGMSSDWQQTHGYYEARMRAYTTGNGIGSAPHPVLLLWPDSNNWSEGELDWVETDIGADGIGVFFHCTNGNPSQNCYHTTHNVDITQWHVYGFEWTATSLKGFVDGVQIYETDGEGGNPTTSFHQTIQLDNNTGDMPVNAGKMEVDWIHMYSK